MTLTYGYIAFSGRSVHGIKWIKLIHNSLQYGSTFPEYSAHPLQVLKPFQISHNRDT